MTTIVVAAAIIERDGRLLVTKRQKGVHLEDYWEFPGGKCDAGETIADCLTRELREELAVDVHVDAEVLSTSHAYDDRVVELHFLRCRLEGDPQPLIAQDMRWVPRAQLKDLQFPPADQELIQMLTADPNVADATLG
jgi:mutator protein MutT